MKRKVFFLLGAAVLLTCIFLWDKNGKKTLNQDKSDNYVQSTGQNMTENQDYQINNVPMSQEEKERNMEELLAVAKKCEPIYSVADKGKSINITLDEQVVHRMVEKAAEDGKAVICGSHDANMINYEKVHESLQKAERGERQETEFYEINASGIFRRYILQFQEGRLVVTLAEAGLDSSLTLQPSQMEKIEVYDWKYTDKGWLIWEKALSKNQEMDMHVFYRILPLDETCREIGNKYINPVSYYGNNLFLEDWNQDSMDKIEFNDLIDNLYVMYMGKRLDAEKFSKGIPKKIFEKVIGNYFDISIRQIETYARYDEKKKKYPWSPIGWWNRISQFYPFSEVVKCVENGDGTVSAYVEAIFVEEGTDCSFRHIVTLREDENGNWIYLGNKVDRKDALQIPRYRARREYEEHSDSSY